MEVQSQLIILVSLTWSTVSIFSCQWILTKTFHNKMCTCGITKEFQVLTLIQPGGQASTLLRQSSDIQARVNLPLPGWIRVKLPLMDCLLDKNTLFIGIQISGLQVLIASSTHGSQLIGNCLHFILDEIQDKVLRTSENIFFTSLMPGIQSCKNHFILTS